MNDAPSPSTPLGLIRDAGSRLSALLGSVFPATEIDDSLLYSTAETDPPTAAYLHAEGLRPEPRTRSHYENWAA